MLQQTQVDRVTPKYRAFIKRFPTISSLAHAPLRDVLTEWSGLGYNRRAKYLHECAKHIVAEHHGEVPHDRATLESLPGIGHSTASGILAFAFNKEEPMIDTNIKRILERVFFQDAPQRDRDMLIFAQTLIPKGRGREWNYALLDIGATVCGVRFHDDACPFLGLHGPVSLRARKPIQKRFAHSDRQYRGMIIRALTQTPQLTQAALHKKTKHIEIARLDRILAGLVREGLVIQKKSSYKLP